MSTPNMNELWLDLADPPVGVAVAEDQIEIDHRHWGSHITAIHEYEYGHRVTLTVNGRPMEFHRSFNPAFEDSFVASARPMNWTAPLAAADRAELQAAYEERNDG